MDNIKFKPLNKDQLIISADRLTRFKDPEEKYLRVFKDIITGNLITPKYKKSELDEMEYSVIKDYAETIINGSLTEGSSDYSINQSLFEYENRLFELDENTNNLIKNKINYDGIIKLIDVNAPKNLKWLALHAKTICPDAESHKRGFLFPVKQLIICEGITEETLLPEFARLLDYDFDKNGVFVISAGGKNQVVKTFYKFSRSLKLPIFVLLDSDAKDNYEEILPRLRKQDKIYILNQGEFEDILPVKLIEKTLKYATENISSPVAENIDKSGGMVHYLEEYFKNRGIHEFKKAEFSNLVKLNISGLEDVSDTFKEIINLLKTEGVSKI